MIDIDSKYKISSYGSYNGEIFTCPECGKNILDNFHSHIMGFSEATVGQVMVVECPYCFEHWYCHVSEHDYAIFLMRVEQDKNVHYESKN